MALSENNLTQHIDELLYTAGAVTSFWKFTDVLFNWLSKRQDARTREVFDEEMKVPLASIDTRMKNLEERLERDLARIHQAINDQR